jgi:hypothetical protein
MPDLSSILSPSSLGPLLQGVESLWDVFLAWLPWILFAGWTIFLFFASEAWDLVVPRQQALHETDPEILNFRVGRSRKMSPHPSSRKELKANRERRFLEFGRFRIEELPVFHFEGPDPQLVRRCFEMSYHRRGEATVEDYAIAYKLALRVLWVSLDELSRWGRELIDSCRGLVEDGISDNPKHTANDFHWTRRQLREYLGWPDKRLRACLDELVSLEYLQALDGSKGKAFVYRLNPNFSHNPKALGLLTPEQLQSNLDATT